MGQPVSMPLLRTAARTAVPGFYRELVGWKWRRRHKEAAAVLDALRARHGLVVQAGPFTGTQYIDGAAGSHILPKLLGSYEEELHDVVNRAISRRHTTVVNIGCGEGYYAVGLARCLPGATVFAFDSDPIARHLCRQLAARNAVERRVIVAGACSGNELRGLMLHDALVVCDCEGYELELLDPERVPGLRHAHLLVELHDCFNPEISRTIVGRFEQTHTVTLIAQTDRRRTRVTSAAFADLTPDQQRVATDEGRVGPTPWAYMTPQRSASWAEPPA
jgi:hypothetical protein